MLKRRSDNRGLTNVMFDLTYARRRGRVIKNNEHTVIVEFISGANTKVRIKRHKRKHNVRPVNVTFMDIYTDLHQQDLMWESGGAYVDRC